MKTLLSNTVLFQMIQLTTEGMHPVAKILTYTMLLVIFAAATILGLAVLKMALTGQSVPNITL